ncbi:hypothetical protein [Runella sp.]|uniref:hypothetical protein n=1 Tax=Runella sp. TaxID=1960881 RepID=UPI003D13DC39
MKRRKFITALLLPATAWMVGCKKYDSWDTIVKGRVVAENNQPVEGVKFQFYGVKETRVFKQEFTFDTTGQSNREGYYQLSYLIPSSTDIAQLIGVDTTAFDLGKTHDLLIENPAGQYIQLGGPVGVLPKDFGKTTVFNFLLRKR